MKPTIDRTWIVTLNDGRQVTIGSDINEDPGVWMLSSAPLLRWMTPADAAKIIGALALAAKHFEDHWRPRKKRR